MGCRRKKRAGRPSLYMVTLRREFVNLRVWGELEGSMDASNVGILGYPGKACAYEP